MTIDQRLDELKALRRVLPERDLWAIMMLLEVAA